MIDNERSTAINPGEAVEEKVSLSDRFGLWLGFHKCSQDDYLAMVDGYAATHGLEHRAASSCAPRRWNGRRRRGARSGRVAWQFIQDLAGRLASRSRIEGRRGSGWPNQIADHFRQFGGIGRNARALRFSSARSPAPEHADRPDVVQGRAKRRAAGRRSSPASAGRARFRSQDVADQLALVGP